MSDRHPSDLGADEPVGDDRVLGREKRRLRSALVIAGAAFQADPWRAVGVLVTFLAMALGGAASAFGMKLVTNAIVERDVASTLRAVAVIIAASGAMSMSSVFGFIFRLRLTESTQLLIDLRLIEMTTGIAGLEHHERADYVDQIERLRDRRQQLAGSIDAMASGLMVVFEMVGTLGLLATVHPVLLLLPLAAIPSFVLQHRVVRQQNRAWEQCTERNRTAKHLFNLTTTAAPGKELRIFGLGRVLTQRHRVIVDEVTDEMGVAYRKATFTSVLGWLVFAAGYTAALAFVVRRALRGEASPGDVMLVLTLGSQVNEQVAGLVGTLNWALQSLDIVRRYLWLMDHSARARLSIDSPSAVPDQLREGIRLEHVTFRYPGTEADVLRDVDLLLPAGSIVAVVGDNGAGKTTLVKLLSRFYEPTSGRITVDGADLGTIDVESWRLRMAAGFQDFAKFELLARETVAVGDLDHFEDEPAVTAALSRAHAIDVIDGLPTGLSTQLGKSFENGQELSGGQWQKLALGRAMMRTAPLLLVLDEPTSALDAETEHALFERYAGAAKEVAARVGAITLLVSHRFSTVRMADLIVVIHSNGVAESGSHAELIRRGGIYAELYELQARAYR